MAEPKDAAGDEMVVTPGGPRRRSLVHEIKKGEIVRAGEDGKIEVVDAEDRVLRQITPPPTEPGPFGTGWISYTSWGVPSGSTVTSFTTTWTVPKAPTTASGQVVFLFNGVQTIVGGTDAATSGNHILQPVLQWGSSGAGGGNYWSIASWFAGNQTQPAAHSTLTQVNEGDTLVGVMTYTGKAKGGLSAYTCSFQGYPNSNLSVQIPTPYGCYETLEAYRITACSDYPASLSTVMGSINIDVDGAAPQLTWTVTDGVTDCGQHAVVDTVGATNGAVEIFYRYPVSPSPPQVNCFELEVEIGNVEKSILALQQAPPSSANSAQLHTLELQLASLQRAYEKDCGG